MRASFRARAEFFRELGQLNRSGISLPQALAFSAGGSAGGMARVVAAGLENGVAAAFRSAGFPSGDCAALEAGEYSGRLGEVFGRLALHYEQLADARKKVIARSLYPLLILHLTPALLLIPRAVMAGDPWNWVVGMVGYLGCFYVGAACVWAAWKLARIAYARSVSGCALIGAIPVLGGWLDVWSAARFAGVFSLVVGAGGSPLKALGLAGDACGNRHLADSAERARVAVRGGMALAAAFVGGARIRPEIERALRVGDHAGRLEEEAARASEVLQTAALAMLEQVAEWVPKLLYIGVTLWTGWMILSMMMSIGGAFGQALDSPLQ